MSLLKISCTTAQDADSVYDALRHNKNIQQCGFQYNLDTVTQDHNTSNEINIYCFPKDIQNEIQYLSINEYTSPIAYDNQFVIFKRLK